MIGDRIVLRRLKIWRVISLLVFLPAGVSLVIFAVVNRHPVVLKFWPLPIEMTLPLSLVILFSLGTGVLWGGLASWLKAANGRRQAREFARRASQAETQVSQLSEHVDLLEEKKARRNLPIRDNYERVESSAVEPSKMI